MDQKSSHVKQLLIGAQSVRRRAKTKTRAVKMVVKTSEKIQQPTKGCAKPAVAPPYFKKTKNVVKNVNPVQRGSVTRKEYANQDY